MILLKHNEFKLSSYYNFANSVDSLDKYFNSNMFDFGFHFISIYFCFILYWSGYVEVQIKAHARAAPFLSFQG